MILRVAKAPLRRALGWMRRLLFVAGVSLLGYCAYVLVDSHVFQAKEQGRFEELLAAAQLHRDSRRRSRRAG